MKVVQENEVDGSDFGEPFNDVTKLAEGDRGAQRGSVDAIGALPTRQFDRDSEISLGEAFRYAPLSMPGNSSLPGMPSRYRLPIAITPYPLWVWRWSLYRAGLA